ncbi:response regulator [Streptoalloteichus hindustanus]|uniref:Two component transcriptional regulator, LuxR family n=1 Tax=Streptoalloteichus hindustanus TaxID=2017 RepID=A0A1M5EXE4_STRHI|nr:response regulator transcription factor [Streptoalloteichus hindustanus]SHF83889.1 two component transcriptional regulator, LuxR family [Streptoalloteichus hindustanus]
MRVVIAEDEPLLREGLTLLLRGRGFEVVSAVGDAEALTAALAGDPPDIVITDIRLPPGYRDEGLRVATEARRRHPGLPVVVLSSYVEKEYARELLSDGHGGVGYLLKDRVGDVAEFVRSVRRVAEGGTAIDGEVVSQLVARSRPDPLSALTPREREVLALMAEGLDNAEIAERLVLTERAVLKHVGNVFTKLDLPPSSPGHRRVRAVLAHLRQAGRGS